MNIHIYNINNYAPKQALNSELIRTTLKCNQYPSPWVMNIHKIMTHYALILVSTK